MAGKQRPAKRPARVAQQAPRQRVEQQPVEPHLVAGPHSLAGLRAACTVLTIDALGLLGGGIYLFVHTQGHVTTNHRAALTQAAFALLGALIFAVLARGARPRHPALGIRTPSVILEIIIIPVSIGLFQSGRPELGAPLLLSALVAITGGVLGFQTRYDDH